MNIPRSLPRIAALALVLLSLAPLRLGAQTVQKSYLFNTATLPDGVSLYGEAKIVTGDPHLSLTEAVAWRIGTVILDPLPKDQWVTSLQVDFRVRIDQGTLLQPADGISFNFGPNLVNDTVSENGAPQGFVVTFDTFENSRVDTAPGPDDTAPAVEVVYDGKVISGASFGGYRSLYQPSWPTATDASGHPLLFQTGTNFVPVSIRLDPSNRVSVFWNGSKVLSDVTVPYTPAVGWRIAIGARTGGAWEAHDIKNVEITASTAALVSVSSEFGGDFVSPSAGSGYYELGKVLRFSAPRYVYLDRYKQPIGTRLNALTGTPYYRARYAGVSIDGGDITHVQDRSFLITLHSGMSVDWQWDLEFLGNISTGTEDIEGLSPSDVTDPAHVDKLGDHFYGNEADAGEIFSSVVYATVGGPNSALPVQFAAKSYLLENAPNAPEKSVLLSSGQDHVRANRTGISWGALSDLTLEFWMRADPSTSPSDRVALSIGKEGASPYLSAGFSAAGDLVLANPAAGFEARLPGYFDTDWHHWALAYDAETQAVLFFRDGLPVHRELSSVNPLAGAQDPVVVGGLLGADGSTLEKPFAGGVNNVRIWSKALPQALLLHAMRTPVYGAGVDGLELELPLDELIPPLANGADAQLWLGGGGASISSVNQISNLLSQTRVYASDTLKLPIDATNAVAGLVFHSTFLAADSGPHTFYLSSDDGSQLYVDGGLVVNHDGLHGESEKSGVLTLQGGYHDLQLLYFNGGGRAVLGASYSTTNSAKQSIPNNLLFRSLGASDPPASYLQLRSTEGRGIPFAFFGAGTLFPPGTSSSDQVHTLFPGFEFKDVGGTGVNLLHLTDAEGKELSYALTDWTRVTWAWQKQFQLTVQVSAPDVGTILEAAQLPFFAGDVQLDGMDSNTAHLDSASSMTALETWVPERAVVTVGTRYRTSAGCLQLTGVSGQQNGFGVITSDQLVDGAAPDGSVSREFAFTNGVVAPGSLVFTFGPIVYKAEIPIGEGLDVSSTLAANAQLVPDLCGANPSLRIDLAGPNVLQLPKPTGNGTPSGGSGIPYAWDFAGRKFHPLQPGSYVIQWEDANDPSTSYVIQIEARFPTDVITVRNRENPDGSRQGTALGYETQVTFPATASAYPASPKGHYHYVVSPNAGDPIPVDLDPNPDDPWAFLRLGFSEDTRAQADTTTDRFTTTSPGIRTVLVFSRRTNSIETATGDLTREALSVRIVESLADFQSQTNVSATVGTRILSQLDQADYGSGYLLNELSNYNPQIHHRYADVGAWGPIYPVNWSGIYQSNANRLRVAWYQNPFLKDATLHPNVGWPYLIANYDDVRFPDSGGNAIYIASRLGSEGVNAAGIDQLVFDPARYANLAIYNQPDRETPGYNPNEEHALVAPSIKAQLTGDPSYNLSQPAAFALQRDINVYGATDSNTNSTANQVQEFTSEPVVLVQYENLTTGELEMKAYRVEAARTGTERFPKLDPDTHLPTDALGRPVPQPANPTYDFHYTGFAGDPVIQPYPVNLVVGSRVMEEDQGGNFRINGVDQRTLWFDKNQTAWIVSGDGAFFHRFWYPFRDDFWFDSDGNLVGDLEAGVPLAWLPTNRLFLEGGSTNSPLPARVAFDTFWRPDSPVLKRGETATYAGGEYIQDHPLAQGLPGIVGWDSAQLIYDSRTPDMIFTNLASLNQYSARVTRPLDPYSVQVKQSDLPSDLTPANIEKVMVGGTRWYFKELPGSLQKRFYFDSLNQELVFRGRLNDLEGDNGGVTSPPASIYVLEPNVMSPGEYESLVALASTDSEWAEAVEDLYLKSQNPNGLLSGTNNPASAKSPVYLAGFGNQPGGSDKEVCFYSADGTLLHCGSSAVSTYHPIGSLGAGAALVPNPTLLTAAYDAPAYVTLVENNDPKVSGTVALQIIRLGEERLRGGPQGGRGAKRLRRKNQPATHRRFRWKHRSMLLRVVGPRCEQPELRGTPGREHRVATPCPRPRPQPNRLRGPTRCGAVRQVLLRPIRRGERVHGPRSQSGRVDRSQLGLASGGPE